MCGIVGYVGDKSAVDIIVEGLKKLEYRGYDSAGVAVLSAPDGLEVRRAAGRHQEPRRASCASARSTGSIGIGHTRWATHGRPSDENAHPAHRLRGRARGRAQRHHRELPRDQGAPAGRGARLHVRDRHRGHRPPDRAPPEDGAAPGRRRCSRRPARAARLLRRRRGVDRARPTAWWRPSTAPAAWWSGSGKGETFVASDIPAILAHTRDVVILEDDEVAVVTRRRRRAQPRSTARRCSGRPARILWDPIMAEKGGYRHFMLKEIYEQPRAIADTLRGRVAAGERQRRAARRQPRSRRRWQAIQRVVLVACGTASTRAARPLHDRAPGRASRRGGPRLGVPLPRRDPRARDAGGRHLAVRRDRRHARRGQGRARPKGGPILAITNVVGSALVARGRPARSTCTPGPEIGVASTKAFTTMLIGQLPAGALARPAARHAHRRGRCASTSRTWSSCPRLMEQTLELERRDRRRWPASCRRHTNFLFLGRGMHYPDRAGRRAQAQGDLLHPRRGLRRPAR